MVQKIFFTVAGTFVYLYLFLSVPGSFTESFGNITSHWVLTVVVVAAIGVGLVALARALKKRLAGMWEHAKEGGVILSTPKRYMTRVFLPSFLSYLCKLGVVAIFLGAFAIPVTFESIMWVVGSGSLANVASFTPGAVGVTQATNALALSTCCDVANDVAIDYSTAQQLITTAWNQILAIVMLLWVFGWSGGKQLVTVSYADAKTKVAETKEERRAKKEAKKEARRREQGGAG
jgi:uncharacterized membrane protein YbhN (UPF0104 family)